MTKKELMVETKEKIFNLAMLIAKNSLAGDKAEMMLDYMEFEEWLLENFTANVCEYCDGSGEVSEMAPVYPGEPHMADIGTRKCICQIKNEE